MKKILLAFSVLSILYFVSSSSIWAKTTTGTESALAQSSGQASVDYNLPYPGILPDSPLYFLKTFRDKLVSIFISDPIKKAEFNLLTADKRLGSGIALFAKKKFDLSETTISKGENYFEDAIKNVKLAKMQGRPIDLGLLKNMELSSKKHKEVIEEMVEKSSGNLKDKFLKDLARATVFVDEVIKFRPAQ